MSYARGLMRYLLLFCLLSNLCCAEINTIDTIDLTVSDCTKSLAFYTEVLDFKKVFDETFGNVHVVQVQLGDTKVNLICTLDAQGRSYPQDFHSNDKMFQHMAIVVSDIDQAYRKLQSQQVKGISSKPERLPDWNPKAGGIKAYYFKDPDGHPLEIISFPPGKGDPQWQIMPRLLFQGIDHTAIVVADTDKSLLFFRDLLGLKVKATSENYGPEQENLSNVPGAHLRITSLRAKEGIGIELLEYLEPKGGKSIPQDTRSTDLWHWQVQLQGKENNQLPHLIKDPDGHQFLIVPKKVTKPTPTSHRSSGSWEAEQCP